MFPVLARVFSKKLEILEFLLLKIIIVGVVPNKLKRFFYVQEKFLNEVNNLVHCWKNCSNELKRTIHSTRTSS